MKMQAENVVKNVESRIIKEGKPEQRMIYDVVDPEGTKWTVWEKSLAEKAWNLKDQTSVWSVEVQQNGSYTNRTLHNIEPKVANGMTQAIGGGTFPTSSSVGNATITTTITPPATGSFAPQPATSKDEAIHRQTAAKVAAALSATPAEFWANVQDLARYFDTGIVPGGDNSAGFTSTPLPTEEPQTDDDIPF
jgi:hypothetical protein